MRHVFIGDIFHSFRLLFSQYSLCCCYCNSIFESISDGIDFRGRDACTASIPCGLLLGLFEYRMHVYLTRESFMFHLFNKAAEIPIPFSMVVTLVQSPNLLDPRTTAECLQTNIADSLCFVGSIL